MAAFGATLKLRLDKDEIDRGLKKVVTGVEDMGEKASQGLGKARRAASRFGKALEPVVTQGLMRLADLGIDQLVNGFRIMGEESKVISGMLAELTKIKESPFRGFAEQIDQEFGEGTGTGWLKRVGQKLETAGAVGAAGVGSLSRGEIITGLGQTIEAGGRLGNILAGPGAFGPVNPAGTGGVLLQEKRERILDEQLRELREMNAKTPDGTMTEP